MTNLSRRKLIVTGLSATAGVSALGVAAKLARTFTLQLEALNASRKRKPAARQTITVRKETHQHVHYHDDRGGSAKRAPTP